MEQIFLDPQKRRNVRILYDQSHLLETSASKRERFSLIIEKVEQMNLFQLRLTEACDHTAILTCSVDNDIFEQIKVEQSINVSFAGFIDYLLQILDGCRRDELHLALVDHNEQKFLQLYEKRPFKNLTHLFLPLHKASTSTVLFHLNTTLDALKVQISNLTARLEDQKAEICQRDALVGQLQTEMNQLRQVLKEKEVACIRVESEEVRRLQLEVRGLMDAREAVEKSSRKELRASQDKLDQVSRELFLANERHESEVKKNEILQEEISRLKPFISANHKLQLDLDQSHCREQRLEQKLAELQRLYNEGQERLRLALKNEQELRAEAEAERNITGAKRNALQVATEEITSANRIILQQSKEIERLKGKIDIRTELALKQEKVVQEREKENQDLQNVLKQVRAEFEASKLSKEEVLDTIEGLQEQLDEMERKHRRKVAELNTALEQAQVLRVKNNLKY